MAPPVTLPTRLIGDTPVSAMGFGAMGFSAFYIPKDKTDEGRLKVSAFLSIWGQYADSFAPRSSTPYTRAAAPSGYDDSAPHSCRLASLLTP